MLHNFTNILNLHTREYKEAAPKVNNKRKNPALKKGRDYLQIFHN